MRASGATSTAPSSSNIRGGASGRRATLRLDEDNDCAFNLWDAWQAPDRPSAEQFARMRQAGEPSLAVAEGRAGADGITLEPTLALPSVTLILVEQASRPAPARPTGLRAEPQSGLSERENMLLTWTPGAHEPVSPAPLLSAAFPDARAHPLVFHGGTIARKRERPDRGGIWGSPEVGRIGKDKAECLSPLSAAVAGGSVARLGAARWRTDGPLQTE